MKIASFTVRHPILTTMIALIVVILGFVALRRLPLDLMPDISFPALSISTSYPNSSPPIVEQLITRPIEEAMAAVPGVEEITSVSSEGSSSVQLSFAWGTDLDTAAADVRDRLDRVIPRLPDDADRPRLFKFDPASIPVLILGAYAEADPVYLRRLIDEQVAYRLERVDGVAAVDVFGGVQREIQVDLLPDRLELLGLPVDQVIGRIQSANVETPLGSVTQGNYERTLRSSALYENLDQLRDTVVAVRQGAPIPLGQVARVSDGSVKVTRIARINGRPGIRLSVSKQSGRNTVEVARQVRRELERIRADFPQLELVVLNDNSRYIADSLRNVGTSALYGALIAVGVLLFFLRNLASTLIIAISIPFSIIATFVLMYSSGFTLNIMSLGGLALGVGMMVDNSIVVLENSFRLRQEGRPAAEAAVDGAGEVTSAVIASTLTTVVVFLPLIFIRGVSGVMYKQLALVVSFALLCSLVSSLTLVPMMSARLLSRAGTGAAETPLARSLGRALAGLERAYTGLLSRALDRPGLTVGAIVLALAASLLLVPLIGSEVMPATDEGQVRISGELEAGTRLGLTDAAFQELERRTREAVPEIQTMTSSVGGGFRSSGGNSGQINLTLVPRRERGRSDARIADDLRRRLSGTPGMTLRTRTSQGFFLMRGGGSNTERVQIEVRGYDLAAARELAGRIRELVHDAPGVTDVQLSQEAGVLEDLVVVDRRRVAELNLTVQQVTGLLRTLIAGSQAGTFREADTEVPIVVRLAAERLSGPGTPAGPAGGERRGPVRAAGQRRQPAPAARAHGHRAQGPGAPAHGVREHQRAGRGLRRRRPPRPPARSAGAPGPRGHFHRRVGGAARELPGTGHQHPAVAAADLHGHGRAVRVAARPLRGHVLHPPGLHRGARHALSDPHHLQHPDLDRGADAGRHRGQQRNTAWWTPPTCCAGATAWPCARRYWRPAAGASAPC